MTYNLTSINSSGMVKLTQGVNTVIFEGYFGLLMIVTLAAILFVSFLQFTRNPKLSLSSSMLIVAVFSLFLMNFELLTSSTVAICWILAGITTTITAALPD